MVFSQTSPKTHSILKVVEIDRLKQEKPQRDGLGGVVTDGPVIFQPSCSNIEDYLKPEPVFDSNMYHDTDCEFFQDLVGWCSDLAKEEQVITIDSTQKTEDRALNTDTLHTPVSPPAWDSFDANFSAAQASFYTTTPRDPLSPAEGFDTKFSYGLGLESDTPLEMREQFVDISSLPVVIGDLAPGSAEPWPATWDTYTKPITEHETVPFIDREDSLDMKYMTSVTPREVENSRDVVISEFIVTPRIPERRVPGGLSLDVAAAARPAGSHAHVISTPEVLSYVEQLEQEKNPLAALRSRQSAAQEAFVSPLAATPAPLEYEPITPKSEAHESEDEPPARAKRRRRRSDDSDTTYSPHEERASPRKYKRRKPSVPLKDMILALEGSHRLTKARRGRPPKRRDSVVSSACSVDDNSSMSNQDMKYRELRDKNNEASKRSRMHRKLKELQMEQEADELEEKNQKLRVQADILEEMTKKLKDALLTSILQK